MARKVAIIENGVIVNVTLAEAARGSDEVDITDQRVGIGWKWNGIEFSPPDPVTRLTQNLTAADLINAFTDEEQDAIFSSTSNKVEKLIQQLLLWTVSGITIKVNARLQRMIVALVDAGILTQARANEIYAQLG